MKGVGVLHASLITALMLMMFPLPDSIANYRPDWLALAIFYWAIALPKHVSLFTILIYGLLADVAMASILGQHSLGYIIIAYVGMISHRRVRVYPLWQQALIFATILALKQTLIMWVDGITGTSYLVSDYYKTVASSMIIWPWAFIILRDLRRKAALR